MRVKLTIAYDGAAFAGWQSQVSGATVQDTLEAALAAIAGARIPLHGAGRTDAGVHAEAQVAHFDAPADSRMRPEDWRRALNARLPATVRVMRAARARADFHARFSARGKVYRYEIWRGDVLPPARFRRAWHVPQPMDLARLEEAAHRFEGTHDFRAFAANRSAPVSDTIRTIAAVRVVRRGPAVRLTFTGNGFLYKMVRMLVGASVRVARDRESLATVDDLLGHPAAGRWIHVAPADGLTLERVLY